MNIQTEFPFISRNSPIITRLNPEETCPKQTPTNKTRNRHFFIYSLLYNNEKLNE